MKSILELASRKEFEAEPLLFNSCTMGEEYSTEMDMEVLPSMWPEDLGKEADRQFNIDQPSADQDMLEVVTITEEPSIVDFKRLKELTDLTEKGSSQMVCLMKHWEARQANAFRLLNEELDILKKQKQEAELKELEILEEHMFEGENCVGDKRNISILEDDYGFGERPPSFKKDVYICTNKFQTDIEHDSVEYWKEQAKKLEMLLDASIERENKLQEKLQENIQLLAKQMQPVEEISQMLTRADNFLHFVLHNAPVVIGHQDKELRYRFIFNHFPSLQEEDIIGKTDVEIFSGAGVKESQDFKEEVLLRGIPAKREITFETELFGTKTFLIYVEPVFSKAGETIGVNYMGMDITDQIAKREKLAKLREEMAVRKAMETELNKTIHITDETMRSKQMLATMSHEIRSPLTGVVGMAEMLAQTRLDSEQRHFLDVMISSGDLILQLINDILDLSKVESGAMKLEATQFRPREVVKHVLQTAAASLQKEVSLEGFVAEEVPLEVIGDVLRMRQILTNLISNSIKFTHEGKVGITLQVTSQPLFENDQKDGKNPGDPCSYSKADMHREQNIPSMSESDLCGGRSLHSTCGKESNQQNETANQVAKSEIKPMPLMDGDENLDCDSDNEEKIVWLHCDVYDTGIGIPEKALPTLFRKYMQASADHARKYGGTGLGLAICKQLVELMGGRLTVKSQEHHGSTFSFIVPCRVPKKAPCDERDNDLLYDKPLPEYETTTKHTIEDNKASYFQFQPRTLGSLFSSNGAASRSKLISVSGIESNSITKTNSMHANHMLLTGKLTSMERTLREDVSTINDFVNQCPARGSNYISEKEKVHKEVNDCYSNDSNQHSQKHTAAINHKPVASWQIQRSEDLKFSSFVHENHGELEKSSHKLSDNTSEVRQTQSKHKILLVEDNKVNVMVTQSIIKRLGHSLDVVSNGVEALRAVQRSNYDLILMDVRMPVMDGLEATRLVRAYELTGNWDAAEAAGVGRSDCSTDPQLDCRVKSFHRKRTPIIAMTANALAEDIAECYANDMDSFVAKPVTFQKLKESLRDYIPG